MKKFNTCAGATMVAAVLAAATVGHAAGPPPPPKATDGHLVTVVARGVPTPTAFAFNGSTVFVAGYGDEEHPKVHGGVYVIRGGKAVKLQGSPAHVVGLAEASGTLYLSNGTEILAWSDWNGTRFAKSRVVAKAPKPSTFNGIAYGPDGKIYAGISLGDARNADYTAGTEPDANDVVAIAPSNGKTSIVAKGLRQPWQPAFVPGHKGPLVSDLGQENLGKKRPPDYIVEAAAGSDFGFPFCPAKASTCTKYTTPFAQFPAHASPMGLASSGTKLYVALFGGTGHGPEVVAMPTGGGSFTPFLTGFAAPVVALGTHAGAVYCGDLTGAIYRTTA
jgi:glucose/arabinose dehydrogenase